MRVENEIGNLVYDSESNLCTIQVVSSQGQQFAFITALDIGDQGSYINNPDKKYYWGVFSWKDEEASIREILATGGKWPTLNQ